MSRQVTTSRVFLVCLLAALTGCTPTQPFYLHEDGDLSHYLDKATQTESPDVNAPPLAEVENAETPFTLSNPEPREMWDLTLEEVVSIALANSKAIRGGTGARLQNGQLSAGTQEGSLVLNSIGRVFATSYDPAIQETNPGLSNNGPTTDGGVNGGRVGVEAALSEFDAQVRIVGNGPNQQMFSTTDRPQNIPVGIPNVGFIRNIQTHQGGLTTEILKRTAEGTQFALRNTNSYDSGFTRGGQFQALRDFWTAIIEVEARHPLLRGRGAQVNRMPIIIARIGNDIEIMSVQAQLQDTLDNIEIRYWDLFFAYRNLETAKNGRDGALAVWRVEYPRLKEGVGTSMEESQAREQYFNFKSQVETSLRNLYDAENELRLLMGLSASDGRLIRPIDDPTLARVDFDWCDSLAEAVARRPELIAKRWQLKQRELEIIWARNQLLPQLDVGGLYRWVGLGENLINADRNGLGFPSKGSAAYDNLTGGEFQEVGVFLSGNFTVGFRKELAGVRHAQLRLARERALLEDMELDVSTGLAKSWRNIDANYVLVQTNANRWSAAKRDVEGWITLRQGQVKDAQFVIRNLLDSQRRLAQAESAFWQSVAEYNKSIADFHTRKGSILEYNGIGFEEGQWPEKAYWDAMGRARQRDAGHFIDYGWTRPAVVSRGEIPQGSTIVEGMPGEDEVIINEGAPEELPTPAPKTSRPRTESAQPGAEEPSPAPMPKAAPRGDGDPKLEARRPLFIESAAKGTSRSGNPLRGSGSPVGTGVANSAAPASPIRQVQHPEPVEETENTLRR